MPKLYLLFGFSTLVLSLKAQQTPLLNVYFDPNTHPVANWDYLRSEIAFVNYVSDRRGCDVQVQLNYEPVGNGAVRYRFFFFGYGAFEGQNDTLSWNTEINENAGSIREKTVQRVKQGLLPYLLQTPLAAAIDYTVAPSKADNRKTEDPWGLRTYRPTLHLYESGYVSSANNRNQYTYNRQLLIGFDTWKITHKTRIANGIAYESKGSRQVLDTQYRKNSIHTLTLNMGYARAIAKRWSAGGSMYASLMDNSNTKAGTIVALHPSLGVEYSLFPYEDFFRRRLTFAWFVNFRRIEYTAADYSGPSNTLWQNWTVDYAKIGRWGYFANAFSASAKLKKTQNVFSMGIDPSVGINVGKNIFVAVSIQAHLNNVVHKFNTLNASGLPAVRREKRLYASYQTNLGLSYYFGSGYRNIVNPRLWGNGVPI